MPSKKRKYNARFPAGRIKKIMQTDEEVGKVAQAVPIIISMLSTTPRTLELFVESLLKKAVQVTVSRNAKTLSPSHVKQCILGESRFDFLRDLVKNIPDVSVAEEKELMSAESSPNSSRFSDMSVQRRVARIDSNSSSGSEVRLPGSQPLPETEPPRPRPEVTATIVSAEAMDLTKRKDDDKPRKANFYQETLLEKAQHRTVIQVNPTYASPQPSTSSYANMTPVEPTQRVDTPKQKPLFFIDVNPNSLTKLNAPHVMLTTPGTPVTPLINIDFSKNLANPEIKVLDTSVAGIVGVKDKATQKVHRQNSKPKADIKRDVRPVQSRLDIDHINSGNLQIDEDYDNA